MNSGLDNCTALISLVLLLVSAMATLWGWGVYRQRCITLHPLSATVCGIALCLAVAGEMGIGIFAGLPYLYKPSLVLAYSPVHYIALLDDSASETINIPDETSSRRVGEPSKYSIGANGLADFLAHHSSDRVALVTFSETPLSVTTLSTSTYDTALKLSDYEPRYQGTDVAAAIKSAIEQFTADAYTGPKALIVTSDGFDSIDPTLLSKFSSQLVALNVRVFGINVVTLEEKLDDRGLARDLQKLIADTGGASFATTNRRETENAYARVGELTQAASKVVAVRATWAALMTVLALIIVLSWSTLFMVVMIEKQS